MFLQIAVICKYDKSNLVLVTAKCLSVRDDVFTFKQVHHKIELKLDAYSCIIQSKILVDDMCIYP